MHIYKQLALGLVSISEKFGSPLMKLVNLSLILVCDEILLFSNRSPNVSYWGVQFTIVHLFCRILLFTLSVIGFFSKTILTNIEYHHP